MLSNVMYVIEHPVSGWQISNGEGQYIAVIDGTEQGAVDHARSLLGREGAVHVQKS